MAFPKIPTYLSYSGRLARIHLVEASPTHCVYKTLHLDVSYTLCLTNLTLTSGLHFDTVRHWDSARGCFTAEGRADIFPVWEENSDEDRVHE